MQAKDLIITSKDELQRLVIDAVNTCLDDRVYPINSPSNKTVFTPKEAAEYIGISQSTLYKLTSAGILPFSKPNGKHIYFSRIGLDNWLLSNSTTSGGEKEIAAATFMATKK